jgi:3-methyladenine DNA glycosylase/8-oxoguanine DNA glycosylase
MLEEAVKPCGPFSLALSARFAGDATRSFRDAILRTSFGSAWQQPDGVVRIRSDSEEGIGRMRFILALDDDHSEFLRRFRRDPLVGRATLHLRGLRPLRTATVAHALLRALCGQLIDSRTARQLERRVVRAATQPCGDLHVSPTVADLGRFSAAELRALGLHARRCATLVRICRSVELERLRELPTDVAAERLERERGLGPWSTGVVCLEGLGRRERGLVGDLGLIKLCRELWGRREVEGWETAELLEPYGEWAGLASVYLLAGFGRGLIPARRLAA